MLQERFALAADDVYELARRARLHEPVPDRRPERARAARRARGRRSRPPVSTVTASIFDAIRGRRSARPSPVRELRRQRRAVHQHRRRRCAHRRDQDDRLSRRRRHAVRALAHQGGRSRQAGRLRDRAEGALRRRAQPALGGGAGTRGRARDRRRREPQDARQGRARRPPGSRRACAATRISAPATTTCERPGSTPTSAC